MLRKRTLKAYSYEDAIILAYEGSPKGALSFSLISVWESDRENGYEIVYYSGREGLYRC